jgi:hypothetical protein
MGGILPDGYPGLLLIKVFVGMANEPENLAQSIAKGTLFNEKATLAVGIGNKFADPVIGLALGNLASEAFLNEHQATVDQISELPHQIGIMAVIELLPGKVRILFLRAVGDKVVANGIGMVMIQKVRNPDSPVTAGGDLPPLQGFLFAGDDPVGKL